MSINSLTSYNPLSINGLDTVNINGNPFDPTTLVPYVLATSTVDLGNQNIKTTFVPSSSSDLTNKTYVDTQVAIKASLNGNNTFGLTNTNNLNGGLQTLQNPLQYNGAQDAFSLTAVAPTTYTYSSGWIANPVSGSPWTATLQFLTTSFYFASSVKYILTFNGIYGSGASWTGTIFNSTTSLTVSDASIAITTSPQNLVLTFTTGSTNPLIYLKFVGTSGTVNFINFTLRQVDTEVIGNLIIDSQIQSNIIQTNGKTTNLASAVQVAQTFIVDATSFATTGLAGIGVPASTITFSTPTYTLTATAGGASFGIWLGSSFTYTSGSKYSFTFTGLSTNATVSQTMLLYTSTYTGGSGTPIGDYTIVVPTTTSTVSGSFTATSNSNLVFFFQCSATGKSISFTGFTMTRADISVVGTTAITGATTITGTASVSGVITATGIATGTPATTIGLNSSNQLIKYANPASVFTGSVSATYIPYASSANTLANSNISQTAIGDIVVNGFMGVSTSVPLATLHVQGGGLVCGGTNYANTNGYMASGSLTLGTITKNYGGGTGGWNTNTAGLLMECLDNTEIAVHDSGTTVASFMYYGSNVFTIGRNMGFGGGASPVNFASYINITGTNGTNTRIGGTSDGTIYWSNPNGSNTHWGYPSGGGSDNYIRGTQTYINTPVQLTGVLTSTAQPFVLLGHGGVGGSIGYGVGAVFGSSLAYASYFTPYQNVGFTNSGTNGWVSTFGRFYAPWTGRYQVNINFYWNYFSAGTRWQFRHFNSGGGGIYTKYCALEGGGIGADTVRSWGTTEYMTASDYFDIALTSYAGVCTAYFSGEIHSSMTIVFLG